MSGIGEFAYTLLLGWMRALVDWFWSIFSGTGNTGAWNWFLSNWKIWLVVLLVGGLVVDWLTWVVRWRPYRLLTSRFRRAPAAGVEETAWDAGAGYYDEEPEEDVEPGEWTEAPFATLSEVDPDWAGDVVIGDEPAYYERAYTPYAAEEPPVQEDWQEQDVEEQDPYVHLYEAASRSRAPYEKTFGMRRVETEDAEPATAQAPFDFSQAEDEEEPARPLHLQEEEARWEEPEPYAEEEETEAAYAPPEGFDPFAPYDAYDPQEAEAYEAGQEEPEAYEPVPEDTGPVMYGRPGAWPGAQFPMVQAENDTPPAEADQPVETAAQEPYDPLFNPDAPPAPEPRRRRRRLHEHVEPAWQPESPVPAGDAATSIPTWLEEPDASQGADGPVAMEYEDRAPARTVPGYVNSQDQWADTRPSRVVRPAADAPAPEAKPEKRRWFGRDKEEGFRTVTGKPVNPKGFKRFTSLQDDPILGLPPMDLTDPFLPATRPDNVDFAPDEGEEYDR